MKKITVLFVLFLSFLLISCDIVQNNNNDNHHEQNNPEIFINVFNYDQTLYVGENCELKISANVKDYVVEFDETILSFENNVFKALKKGSTDVLIKYKDEIIKSFKITVIKKMEEINITNVPDYLVNNDLYQLKCDYADVTFSTESDLIKIKENGFITVNAKGCGDAVVRCSVNGDEEVYTEVSIKILTTDNKLIVKKGISEDLIIGNYIYYYNKTCFNNITTALSKANVSNELFIVGELSDDFVINKSNIKLCGNYNEDAEYQGKILGNITIAKEISKVTISGLEFSDLASIILTDGNTDITIDGNRFIDSAPIDLAWQEDNSYTSGIIKLEGGTNFHNNITISNNYFENINDVCINASNIHNFSVINNTFKNFDKDAVRMNNGVLKINSVWRFIDNTFENGAYSGLYFRTCASNNAGTDHLIQIFGNSFDNCGKVNTTYTGCITFRNYQEGLLEINISFNSFKNSNKYLFLRNNAVVENQKNYTAYITYNNFLTKPNNYYFNNLNNSDTVAKNPKQAILRYNYYNNETLNDNLFIGCLENSNILNKQIGNVNKEFYNLRHNIVVNKEYLIPKGFDIPNIEGITKSEKSFKATADGIYNIKFSDGNDDFYYEFKATKDIELVVKFINIALGEIGYQEMDANGNTGTSGNYTKYGAWYGINPGAWCAMYVSWCANQAGVPRTIIPKYASVQIGMEWYQEQGLFQYKENYTPKAGDIMFMKSDGASHTGIVLYCDGTTLYTVEGNTSDCCAMRKYNVNYSKITGYGTPLWPYYNPDGYDFSNGQAQDGSGQSTT